MAKTRTKRKAIEEIGDAQVDKLWDLMQDVLSPSVLVDLQARLDRLDRHHVPDKKKFVLLLIALYERMVADPLWEV